MTIHKPQKIIGKPVMAPTATVTRRPLSVQPAAATVPADRLVSDQVMPSATFAEGYHTQPSASVSYSSPDEPHSTLDALGQRSQRLVKAINQLEGAGIEASGLPLPKIVAIGDQSAGKSSLIEAISEIKVPRAAGTCTRCPLQINLVQQTTTAYKVSVHHKYFYLGEGRGWESLDKPEDVASVELPNISDLEKAIHFAQAAILSPNEDAAKILTCKSKPKRTVEFSPNVVKIDVAGPTLPTLTMYDLPGIIAQARNNDDSLPSLITALAEEYMSGSHTIVMLACQVGSDFQNSNAAALVTKLGAHKRTIGVITKPDKLTQEDAKQWFNLIKGHDPFTVGHKFFVTKQPSSEEINLGISHGEARAREKGFFEKSSLWNSSGLNQAQFKERCGTANLQSAMSRLLAEEIARALPDIERTIDQKLATTKIKLEDFPGPQAQENAIGTVLSVVNSLQQQIAQIVAGEYPNNELIHAWREKTAEYKRLLIDMQPVAVMVTGPEEQWRTTQSEPIAIDDDEDDYMQDSGACPGSGSKRPMPPPSTPTKRRKQASVRNEHAQKFTLDGIRKTIRDRSTSGLQRPSDPHAEDALITESLQHWKVPLLSFLGQMRLEVKHIYGEIAERSLHRWTTTPLADEVKHAIQKYLDGIHDVLQRKCLAYLDAELYKPTTFNDDVLEFFRKKELVHFQEHRKKARQSAYLTAKELSGEVRRVEGIERDKKISAIKENVLLDDPFAAEIEVMARIRGYYDLAASSTVDFVCKTMQHEIFETSRRDLAHMLSEHLEIYQGPDTCKKLLIQDHGRELKRLHLIDEKAKLELAKSTLAGIHV